MLQYDDDVTMTMVMMAMSNQSNKLPSDPGAKEEIYHSLTLAKTSKEQHGDDDGDDENILSLELYICLGKIGTLSLPPSLSSTS